MGPTTLTRVDDRMAAFREALAAALPGRVIKGVLLHHAEQKPEDLDAGVVMAISTGERSYHDGIGMVAKEGTQGVLLLVHIKVDDDDAEPMKAAVEAAEFTVIEEIKWFLRQGVAGMSLSLDRVEQSRQIDAPLAWVVMFVDMMPPRATTH